MFAGKKRMGQRGWRERVGLYFSTSCLFSCVDEFFFIFFYFYFFPERLCNVV